MLTVSLLVAAMMKQFVSWQRLVNGPSHLREVLEPCRVLLLESVKLKSDS